MTRACWTRRVVRFAAVAFAVAGAAATRVAPAADPAPAYFSYGFGGSIQRIATGAGGRIYLAGWTDKTDLPASTSHPDPLPPRSQWPDSPGFLFAAALAPDGQPLWTSYVPAGDGYSDMGVGGIAAGDDGSVWIVGAQRIGPVNAFRTATPDTYDGFFAKFSADGELLVASYLDDQYSTWVEDVVVDPSGDAFIAGSTSSPTFPGAPVEPASGLDGFAARIRADGSDVVWTQRFRGSGYYAPAYCGGVARDAASGTIVVSFVVPEDDVGAPPYATLRAPDGVRVPYWLRSSGYETAVIRLDAEGNLAGGTRLPFLGALRPDGAFGLRTPIAIAPDGSVLIAGFGRIAKLSPELDALLGLTHDSFSSIQRIATDANGRVFVVDVSRSGYQWHSSGYGSGAAIEFGQRGDRNATLVWQAWGLTDLAVDTAGDTVYVGPWEAGPFNAPADARPSGIYGTITKAPLEGVRSPSRLRARARGPDTIDVEWSADGDPVVRYELMDYPDAEPVVLADDLPPTATEFRAAGVAPGTVHLLELVSVFANGVRSVTYERVRTRPVRSASVVATDAEGQAVDVTWHDPNGVDTQYRVERRVGDGPWIELDGAESDAPLGQPAVLHDLVPDVAAGVAYRVRSALHTDAPGGYPVVRFPTPWTVSAPMQPSATLRVLPGSGAFYPLNQYGGSFVIEGVFVQLDGRPGAPFDPRSQELRLLYGEAAHPNEFVLAPGDPAWSESGGVWTWSAARTLNVWDAASEVVVSPLDGTFQVRLQSAAVRMQGWSGSVAFNLRFGQWSGGDVRKWQPPRGNGAAHTFPAAAATGSTTSRRAKESER